MPLIGLRLKFISTYDITLLLRTFGILEYFKSSIFRLDCSVVLMAVKIKWPIHQAPEPLSHTCTKSFLLYLLAPVTVSILAHLALPFGDLAECVTPAPHTWTGQAGSCPFKRRNSAYFRVLFYSSLSVSLSFSSSLCLSLLSLPPLPSISPIQLLMCILSTWCFCLSPSVGHLGPAEVSLMRYYVIGTTWFSRLSWHSLLFTFSLRSAGTLGPWNLHQPLSLF